MLRRQQQKKWIVIWWSRCYVFKRFRKLFPALGFGKEIWWLKPKLVKDRANKKEPPFVLPETLEQLHKMINWSDIIGCSLKNFAHPRAHSQHISRLAGVNWKEFLLLVEYPVQTNQFLSSAFEISLVQLGSEGTTTRQCGRKRSKIDIFPSQIL